MLKVRPPFDVVFIGFRVRRVAVAQASLLLGGSSSATRLIPLSEETTNASSNEIRWAPPPRFADCLLRAWSTGCVASAVQQGKEMGPVFPVDMFLIDELQISFIYQSRGLKRVTGILPAHVVVRQ